MSGHAGANRELAARCAAPRTECRGRATDAEGSCDRSPSVQLDVAASPRNHGAMNNRLVRVAVVSLACVMLAACARSSVRPPTGASQPTSKRTPSYVGPSEVPYRTLLPAPAQADSAMTRAEGRLLRAVQADAVPEAAQRAQAEDTLRVWAFADVMGAGFEKSRLPELDRVMTRAETDTRAISDEAKNFWKRPRPASQDESIQTAVATPGNGSYPSGHATRATVWARLLAEIVPEKRDALRRRAAQIGLNRVVGGVHYPTDVIAGYVLGDAIADRLLASPAFKADFARVKAEWAGAHAAR